MATKLCECGSCEQAIDRALGVIRSQLMDGECPYFILGVHIATESIMGAMLSMSTEGETSLVGVLNAAAILEGMRSRMEEPIKNDSADLRKRIVEMMKEVEAKQNEERNLPKGD